MRCFALAAAALLIVSGDALTAPAKSLESAMPLELAMGPTSAPHKPGGNPDAAGTPSYDAGSPPASTGGHHRKSKHRHGTPRRN